MEYNLLDTPPYLKEECLKLFSENYENEEKDIFRKQLYPETSVFERFYKENNLPFNGEGGNIEFCELIVWKREHDTKNSKILHDFQKHRDLIKVGKRIVHVNTCIVYLENSFLSGGNLNLYNDCGRLIEKIKVKEDKTFLFDGDIMHCPEYAYGNGRRVCIVFQKEK